MFSKNRKFKPENINSKKRKYFAEIDINQITEQAIKNSLNESSKNIDSLEKFIGIEPTGKKAIIEIKNLVKVYGTNERKNVAINNISFNVYENENLALLGSNGAGKTTTVEIISGLNKLTSGTINYNLGQIHSFQEQIGIQFQENSYPPGITVRRVIKFSLDIYKKQGKQIDKNWLNALIKIFGINDFYFKNANSLSGGQMQRLNCLLAIINRPKLVILDELSTGLDITIRKRIKEFIKQYSVDNKMTILLVSHNLDEVEYLAERIIIMHKGIIFINATKDEIIEKYGSVGKCLDTYI